MKTRVISGLAMMPLLAVIYFGGIPLFIAVAIIMVMGLKEFYDGFKSMKIEASLNIGLASVAGLLLIGIWGEPIDFPLISLWVIASLIGSLLYMFNIEKRKPEDSMATILGILYVGFLAFHVVLVDRSHFFSRLS